MIELPIFSARVRLELFCCVVSGLTFEESMNPAALAKYQEALERKRADLWNLKKNHYVALQVKVGLDCKVTAALDQRDELVLESDQLHLRYELIC